MKLYESGALELIKDIENNRTNVSPEEIAPDVDEDEILPGIRYDSSKDPEAGGGDDSTGLNESTRLTEGYDDDFKDWLSSTDDGSFEDFQNSDSYENIGKRPWTQQQYKDAISRILVSFPKLRYCILFQCRFETYELLFICSVIKNTNSSSVNKIDNTITLSSNLST